MDVQVRSQMRDLCKASETTKQATIALTVVTVVGNWIQNWKHYSTFTSLFFKLKTLYSTFTFQNQKHYSTFTSLFFKLKTLYSTLTFQKYEKTLLLSLSRIKNTIPLSLSGIKDIIPHCGIHSHRIEQEMLCAVISINTFNFSVFITMSARPPTIRGKEFYFNCEGMSSVIDLCSILRPTGNEISANIIFHTFSLFDNIKHTRIES